MLLSKRIGNINRANNGLSRASLSNRRSRPRRGGTRGALARCIAQRATRHAKLVLPVPPIPQMRRHQRSGAIASRRASGPRSRTL